MRGIYQRFTQVGIYLSRHWLKKVVREMIHSLNKGENLTTADMVRKWPKLASMTDPTKGFYSNTSREEWLESKRKAVFSICLKTGTRTDYASICEAAKQFNVPTPEKHISRALTRKGTALGFAWHSISISC